ncbi:MAG: hypothetical protein GY708_15745 [Actinomycetia bacterium]|nr:hypothetical protein [Actinomycetes bacterium]MCP4960716.1 hypothetical protein [Actinomycetes bacterium]
MKITLLVNGAASSVTARTRVMIRKTLSHHHDVTVATTSRRGHASRLARGAAAKGTDVVVTLGGDGTLNEAANGLAGTGCALAALPGGSTNVFARTMHTPDDPVVAAQEVLEAIDRGSLRRVGLPSVNGRYFLFHAGLGFDAAVVEQVEKRSWLKRYAGHPLFIWAGFSTWVHHYDKSRPRMSFEYGDGTGVHDVYLGVVLNTDPYTYLGSKPLSIDPEATIDTSLSTVGVRTMQFRPMMRLVGHLVKGNGRLIEDPLVEHRRDVADLVVRGHGPFPYQLDGDHLGDTEELTFTWRPDVLTLVVP